MTIQISKLCAIKRLMNRVGSIEDNTASGKLKLADFCFSEMG